MKQNTAPRIPRYVIVSQMLQTMTTTEVSKALGLTPHQVAMDAYWARNQHAVSIPDGRRFNGLKSVDDIAALSRAGNEKRIRIRAGLAERRPPRPLRVVEAEPAPAPDPRCKCGLRLPCNGCLPTTAVAYIRRGDGPVYP